MNACASSAMLGRRGLAGADRPDGLVGDHEAVVIAGREGDRLDLDLEHELGVPRLALLERLADAGDHARARPRARRAARRATVSSRLAEELAPLRVADERALHAELEQHLGRDLARVGAARLPVHVLGVDRPSASRRLPRARRTAGRRRRRRRRAAVEAPRRTRASRRGPLNIFQLPAISIGVNLDRDRDRGHAGELLALEQLERRAAAGRDPGDRLGEPELVHRADGVAAADDRVAVGLARRPGRRPSSPRRTAPTRRRPSARSRRPSSPAWILRREIGSRVSGPMSSPSQPSGTRVARRRPASPRRPRTRGRDDVDREHDRRTRAGSRPRSSSAILPPTSTSSARPPRFSSTPSLSSTLAPPDDEHERPLDLAEQPPERARARARGAGRRRRAAGARRPRSRRARGAPSRTRR